MNKIAIIGSGVMGLTIAAHFTNANYQVLLFDVANNDASNRNKLAHDAILKLATLRPLPITKSSNIGLITACNLSDDLNLLSQVDWVIEAIIEDIDIKRNLYKIIEQNTSPMTIISSNTSTILLATLIKDFDLSFKSRFLITHFFNPPRYMQLLELVTSKYTDCGLISKVIHLCEYKLGKTIIKSNDQPGFIANRLGCFWLECAKVMAIKFQLTIVQVDQLMSKPLGIPKTGVFGLMDLIGIDLMQMIAKSLVKNLPKDDLLAKIYANYEFIDSMIKSNHTGRKGLGGFYKLNPNLINSHLTLNLINHQYEQTVKDESLLNLSLAEIITYPRQKIRDYFITTIAYTLNYAGSLIPKVTESIIDIDSAMKLGFNWSFGPFELIDKIQQIYQQQGLIQTNESWLIKESLRLGIEVPTIMNKQEIKLFYPFINDKPHYLTSGNYYQPIKENSDLINLTNIRATNKLVYQGSLMKLIDIDDDIGCLLFTDKPVVLNYQFFSELEQALNQAESYFKGLVITSNQANFCLGADLKYLYQQAVNKNFTAIEDFIHLGQTLMMRIKYSTIPIIAALGGLALGGGCELLMHSQAINAHIESYVGLVEVKVGLIPAWGGCKELIIRNESKVDNLITVFNNIMNSYVTNSAQSINQLGLTKSKVTMNINHLINDAKQFALNLSSNFIPIQISKSLAINDFTLDSNIISLKLSPHDQLIAHLLLELINKAYHLKLNEESIMRLEQQVFIQLLKTTPTLERIKYMLEFGKKLNN